MEIGRVDRRWLPIGSGLDSWTVVGPGQCQSSPKFFLKTWCVIFIALSVTYNALLRNLTVLLFYSDSFLLVSNALRLIFASLNSVLLSLSPTNPTWMWKREQNAILWCKAQLELRHIQVTSHKKFSNSGQSTCWMAKKFQSIHKIILIGTLSDVMTSYAICKSDLEYNVIVVDIAIRKVVLMLFWASREKMTFC